MADYTSSPEDGGQMAYYRAQGTSTEPRSGLTTLTNTAGALVSLALIAGIGVWGYKLFVRDVSGIPVVRAAEFRDARPSDLQPPARPHQKAR